MKWMLRAGLLLATTWVSADEAANEIPVITEMDGDAAIYGASWESGPVVSIAEAIAGFTGDAGDERVFAGRITQVCQRKGCWMILEQDGKFARVDFNNHSFFIPKDSLGPAQVRGVLTRASLSEEKRAHLAEDGAELPQDVYEITAYSVRIGA